MNAYRKSLIDKLDQLYQRGWVNASRQFALTATEAETILRTITELRNADEPPRSFPG